MKVVGVFHAYPPVHNAGAEWMAHAMLRHLVRCGHEVVVLSRDNPDSGLDGVQVLRHRMPVVAGRVRRPPPVADARAMAQMRSADVLVSHLEYTVLTTLVGASLRTPVVHLMHNTFGATREASRMAGVGLVVANSRWMHDDYLAWTRNRRHPELVVVRPPVDPDDYRTTPGSAVTQINLFESKGGKVFWRIAQSMPDVEFLAVKGAYGTQVLPGRVPDNVTVVEQTPNVRDDVYARTRVLLVPSSYESWGRVGVEALASGIPVVAHPTPGLLESLGDAGVFYRREDTDSWVRAIRDLLDPEGWRRASARALLRSADLHPKADLDLWQQSVEALV